MPKHSAPWPEGRPPEAPGSVRVEAAADEPEPAAPSPEISETAHVELSADEFTRLCRRIEALLFVSAKPLNARRLAELLGLKSVVPVRRAADALRSEYASHSFDLRETAGGYQVLTRPEYEEDALRLARARKAQKLTQGAMETLAVIAYKQPITRTELDAIRGAASDHHLRNLTERGLIKVTGRHRDERTVGPGAAMYGTTTAFLDEFGLGSIGELPAEGDLAPPPPEPAPADQPAVAAP